MRLQKKKGQCFHTGLSFYLIDDKACLVAMLSLQHYPLLHLAHSEEVHAAR